MNPYLILSTTDRETEFTRALTYWLSPHESHELSTVPSQLFINLITEVASKQSGRHQDLKSLIDQPAQAVQAEVRLEFETQVDILITTKNAHLLIELKLWASEGEKQLARYIRLAESKKSVKNIAAVVFITPDGRAPISTEHRGEGQVLCMSFLDIKRWISRLLSEQLNLHQMIGLSQFRDWILYIIENSNQSRTPASFDKNQLTEFWNDVGNNLRKHLEHGYYPGWSVRFSNERELMVEEGPYLDGAWSKLGFYFEDERRLKHPMVVLEGIEGFQSGCFGVRHPLEFKGKIAGTEAEELELIEILSSYDFRKVSHYFGISYFNSSGWPAFQPDDKFTRAVLRAPDLGKEISRQMADAMFFILSKTHKKLERISFNPK